MVRDPAPEQRILDSLGQLPEGGAITGWAALRLHGAAYFDGRSTGRHGLVARPVLLAAGRREGRRPADGVRFSYEPLPGDEVVRVHGVPVTIPVRALFDELRRLEDPRSALVAVEMAMAARVVRLPAMKSYAQEHRSWRRSLAAIAALERARPGARSPTEVELRDLCETDGGLPLLGINVPIFDLSGSFLLEADLLGEVVGLVIEYNGVDHAPALQRSRDADRDDVCRRHGLEYTTVVGPDMRRPGKVLTRVRSAWERAEAIPLEKRRWTTDWPPGWTPWWR